MNYIISFLLCLALSVMSVLNGSSNSHWLFVSDINVAIFLAVAWLLDNR